MAITDIFSTSLLISLAICLLLVGSVFMYFNQKIAEQNHKITSMFDLVSTMAEETNSVKYHIQMVASRVGIPIAMQQPYPQQQSGISMTEMNGGLGQSNKPFNNLIAVSEGEDEDEDEDEDEEDDEDDEDDEEDDDDEDDEDEEDDEDDEEDDDDEDDEDEADEDDHSDDDNQDIKINEEDGYDLDIENLENLNFESVADLPSEVSESLTESDMKNLKTININISSTDNENDEEELDSEDISDVNNIKNIEVLDYKKLSLNKLRSIVTEKGIVTDASKLKKHELLKLLEVE